MAWSYTQSSGERYRSDGSYYVRWWNAWSVTELAPVSPNAIRLRVELSTQGFGKNGYYTWTCTDELVCGSSRVTVRGSYEPVAGLSYTATVEVPQSWSGERLTMHIGWCSATATLTATAALPSAVSAEDGSFGRAVPITVTPAFSGVRHRLTASCAGNTELLLSAEDSATALSWTPALATYASLLPNAGSAVASLCCETFFNGISMGSETRTITLRFEPGALAPQLSPGWAAATVCNEGAAAGFSVWIQGYSRAELHFDPARVSCLYGASIAGYALRCAGVTVTQSPWRSPVLPETEAELLCTVTDTRGQSASETLHLTLCAYAPPVIQSAAFARCDAGGAETEDGTCLAVTAAAVVSALGGENSAALSLRSRALSGSFGAATALAPGVRTVLSGFSPDTSCELELTLTDGLGSSARLLRVLPTRRWAMKFRPDGGGVAFGKAAESAAALELAPGWALELHGPNGESARLDYASLVSLLGMIT